MKKVLYISILALMALAVSCGPDPKDDKEDKLFVPENASDFIGTVWVQEEDANELMAFFSDGVRTYRLDGTSGKIILQRRSDYTFADGAIQWEERNSEVLSPGLGDWPAKYSGVLDGEKIAMTIV